MAICELLEASRGVHAGQLGEMICRTAERLGLADARLWLADLQQHCLVPYGGLAGAGEDGYLAIDGTLAGWAYRSGELQCADADSGTAAVWVPLVDGGERLGVLGGEMTDREEATVAGLRLLAGLAARFVASDQRYGDLAARTRRLRPVSVPAEVQRSLLPPLSCATTTTAIGGVLEPAYDIGGDSFDYAVSDDRAWLAVFDAMGHGLNAALMVSLAVSAYRHARRTGADVAGCYERVDETIASQFGPDRFVTGVLAELDTTTGELVYLVAGHHPGVVLRAGRVVRHLGDAVRLPFGLGNGLGPIPSQPTNTRIGAERLEPGDRVLLYTDGVVEARDRAGDFFGLDRLEELLVREDASGSDVPETLRRLVHAVLEHQAQDLQDDATLVLLQWRAIVAPAS